MAVICSSVSIAPKPGMRPLPLRRVTLYGHGVGYFERQGKVDGDQQVTFTFDAAQLNDVLKSLVVLDLNKGKIASVTYDSTKPFEKRLSDFSVNLNQAGGAGLAALFGQLSQCGELAPAHVAATRQFALGIPVTHAHENLSILVHLDSPSAHRSLPWGITPHKVSPQ